MATKTTNYGLTKPAGSDYYNVNDFNDNADIIDEALKRLSDGKADVDEDGFLSPDCIPSDILKEDDKGAPGGVAALDETGKVLQDQLPEQTPPAHSHSADEIHAGTFAETGVRAKDGEDYATSRLRNIMSSDIDLTAGTSPLPSGSIYIVFE